MLFVVGNRFRSRRQLRAVITLLYHRATFSLVERVERVKIRRNEEKERPEKEITGKTTFGKRSKWPVNTTRENEEEAVAH